MRILVRMAAENQGGTQVAGLYPFETTAAAEQFIRDWLTRACGLTCVPAGTPLEEDTFLCPPVDTPADLEAYAGYYHYESLGSIELLLHVVYDAKTAQQLRLGLDKEFGLQQSFEEAAEELIEQLETIEAYFAEHTAFPDTAVCAVDRLIREEGLPLF